MRFWSSSRDSAVANSAVMARLTPRKSSANRTAAMIVVRRESRTVLAKMLPRP
jgi:hypothetical protein